MPRSKPNAGPEEFLQILLEQARAKWGPNRAGEIQGILENASRQLAAVSGNLPDKETEPGFYQ